MWWECAVHVLIPDERVGEHGEHLIRHSQNREGSGGDEGARERGGLRARAGSGRPAAAAAAAGRVTAHAGVKMNATSGEVR